jgi:hypothetical protein
MGFRQIDSANKKATQRWLFYVSGGADGTRTRDPRRDRPGDKVNTGAGFGPFSFPKKAKQAKVSFGFPQGFSKILGRAAITTPPKSNQCRHRGSSRLCGGFVIFGRWIGQPLDR